MEYDPHMGPMMGDFTRNHHNIASIGAWDGHIHRLCFNLYPPGTPSPERPSRSQDWTLLGRRFRPAAFFTFRRFRAFKSNGGPFMK